MGLEKGESRLRALILRELGNTTSRQLSGSSESVEGGGLVVEDGQHVDEGDALHALERRLEQRLDTLFHVLAANGEMESNPPEYDGNGLRRQSDCN